jgi:hypothetical protein
MNKRLFLSLMVNLIAGCGDGRDTSTLSQAEMMILCGQGNLEASGEQE